MWYSAERLLGCIPFNVDGVRYNVAVDSLHHHFSPPPERVSTLPALFTLTSLTEKTSQQGHRASSLISPIFHFSGALHKKEEDTEATMGQKTWLTPTRPSPLALIIHSLLFPPSTLRRRTMRRRPTGWRLLTGPVT